MEFTTTKSIIEHALGKLQSVVDTRVSIPILSNIKIESNGQGIDLTATNLETTIFCHVTSAQLAVTEAGAMCVPGKQLFDIVRCCPDGPIKIARDQNDWVKVQATKAKFRIPGADPEAWPDMPDYANISWVDVPSRVLKSLISGVDFAIPTNSSNYAIAGAYLELNETGIEAVATDGLRIAMAKAPLDTLILDKLSVLIPEKGVAELLKLLGDFDGTVNIGLDEQTIFFRAAGNVLSTRLAAAEFPNYKTALPLEWPNKCAIAVIPLIETLRRAALISAKEINHLVKCEFNESTITISAQHPETGECNEQVECKFEGDTMALGFNVQFFSDFISLFKAGNLVIESKGPEISMLIYPESLIDGVSYRYMLMPVRL